MSSRSSKLLFAISMLLCASQSFVPGTAIAASDGAANARAITSNNEGLARLEAGSIEEAEKLFETSLQLAPDNFLYNSNCGYALLKLGKTPQAIELLTKATKLNPNFDLAWLNLGIAYEDSGKKANALSAFQKYVSLTKPSKNKERIEGHIALLKKETTTSLVDDNPSDYYSTIAATDRLRWPAAKMPIKVFIAGGRDNPRFKPEYESILTQALDAWTQASGGKLSYTFVSAAPADITVEWTTDTAHIVNIAEGGDTKFRGDSQGMSAADIKLLLIDPEPRKLTTETMRWMTLHEVGHALGLLSHSPNPADIMYATAPQVDRQFALSDRDKQTMQRYYAAELPKNWLALNDEGIAFAQKGDYEHALQKYQEALQQSPGNATPLKNAIRAQYSWAIKLIKSGNLTEPEKHFAAALDLERQTKDENLPVLIESYARYLRLVNHPERAQQLEKAYKE